MSNRRAEALARKVRRWGAYGDAWIGEVPPPADYGRPVRVFVKRRLKKGRFCHSYVEQFRSDKDGLGLAARRKRSFLGQGGYILLTDLAHNLLAEFYHHALAGTRFESYGPKRIVRDLLAIPGRLVFEQDHLARVELLSLNQNDKGLAICLERFCETAKID